MLRHIAAIAAIVALIAAHGLILKFLASYTALSLALVLAVGGFIAISHLRLLGPAYAALRHYFHRKR